MRCNALNACIALQRMLMVCMPGDTGAAPD